MTVQVSLYDDASSAVGSVSGNGEVIVGDYAHSDSYFVALGSLDPVEVVPGVVGFDFIVMSFWITASKTVSPTAPASIIVYQAHSSDLTTNLGTKIAIDLTRGQFFPSPSRLRLAICSGCSLVATTDDFTVNVTIVGYYEPHRDTGV